MKYNIGETYNSEETYNYSTPTVFKEIDNPVDLIRYLCDAPRRLANSSYIYHYTSIDVVINMIRGKCWHLGNARNMNDKLEFLNGDKALWPNIFFSSFMAEDKESIGMWSMYAQPWEKGVKIAIPSRIAQSWIRRTHILSEISLQDYNPTGRSVQIRKGQLKLSSVTYSNTESRSNSKEFEKLYWSNTDNELIRDASHIKELTGYVKDKAWSYEKEIRIRAEFNNYDGYERVAIELPDDVIDSMIITASPLFDGDLGKGIQNEANRIVRTDKSLFKERLNIKTICQTCSFRNQINK